MNKNTCKTVRLSKGEMHIYDFGAVKLHAYRTNDPICDEVFVLEKNGKAVIIESPCFFDNNSELAEYVRDVEVAGMLIAYHAAGGSFLPDVPKYATQNAVDYSVSGGGKALIDQFAGAFGKAFDSDVHRITHVVGEGRLRSAASISSFGGPQRPSMSKSPRSTPSTPICSGMTAIPSSQVRRTPTL